MTGMSTISAGFVVSPPCAKTCRHRTGEFSGAPSGNMLRQPSGSADSGVPGAWASAMSRRTRSCDRPCTKMSASAAVA